MLAHEDAGAYCHEQRHKCGDGSGLTGGRQSESVAFEDVVHAWVEESDQSQPVVTAICAIGGARERIGSRSVRGSERGIWPRRTTRPAEASEIVVSTPGGRN